MKLFSFFLLSVALHATIFMIPAPFTKGETEKTLPVILLTKSGTRAEQGAAKNKGGRKAVKNLTEPRQALEENAVPVQSEANLARPFRETSPAFALESSSTLPAETMPPAQSKGDEPLQVKAAPPAGISPAGKVDGEGTKAAPNTQKIRGFALAPEISKSTASEPSRSFSRASYAYSPAPEYPERARRRGWEGVVLLAVLVDREGRPERIEVSRSSGFPTLDEAARGTVGGWRFYPARQDEEPVRSWVKIPIVFRLAGPERATKLANRQAAPHEND